MHRDLLRNTGRYRCWEGKPTRRKTSGRLVIKPCDGPLACMEENPWLYATLYHQSVRRYKPHPTNRRLCTVELIAPRRCRRLETAARRCLLVPTPYLFVPRTYRVHYVVHRVFRYATLLRLRQQTHLEICLSSGKSIPNSFCKTRLSRLVS